MSESQTEAESAAVEAMISFDGAGDGGDGPDDDDDGAEAALVSMSAGENGGAVVRLTARRATALPNCAALATSAAPFWLACVLGPAAPAGHATPCPLGVCSILTHYRGLRVVG